MGHADFVAGGRRGEGHSVDQVRVVLQVQQLRHGLRRAGEARIGGDILHPLPVDGDVAVVPQAFQIVGAGSDRHGVVLRLMCPER